MNFYGHSPIQKGSVAVVMEGSKFSIEWDTDYYATWTRYEDPLTPCSGCGGTGRVTLQDNSRWSCPMCSGEGEIKAVDRVYYPVTFYLHRVTMTAEGAQLVFNEKGVSEYSGHALFVNSADLATMRVTPYYPDDLARHIYETREEAQAEADRLNAQSAERSNDESGN